MKSIAIKQFLKFRTQFIILITSLLGAFLLYQYFNEGIPGHHLLMDQNLPKISNVWGILVIPILSWICLNQIKKRIFKTSETISFPKNVLGSFFLALIFGIIIGISVEFDFKLLLDNIPLILFGLAIFFPIYRPEYFLGFVLGLTYFIGGVLPVLVGGVFLLIIAVIHFTFQFLITKIFKTKIS